MSIRVALNHQTSYRYDRPVQLSPHVFRLRPAVHCRTPIESYSLRISPEQHFINWQQDPFGNFLARVVFPNKVRELKIEVDLIARVIVINPFDFFVEDYATTFPFHYEEHLRKDLAPYLELAEDGPLLRGWLQQVDRSEQNTVDFLVYLNRMLWQQIEYSIRMEPGVQTCEQTLDRKLGSCRDSAWLLVQILRHLGFAARFVSGYLIQLAADVKALDGPSGPERDFTDLHAWAEVYVPGAGWLGLDPTSGLFAGEGHIPLACTPDPVSAAPVTGYSEKCETEFFFANSVKRIHEDPRVTKPYTDRQWQAIRELGRSVDASLLAGDVRLTMGGEPTFVCIDQVDAPEWNFNADGENKRRLAEDLLKRLKTIFAPGGMLHFGQGKWYPGEPLPRWQLSCYWRKDGIPVWRDERLLAGVAGAPASCDPEAALKLARCVARVLRLDADHVIPGYEDAFYYLWLEGNLPVNLDPLTADLSDPIERRELARALMRGLSTPTGFALPLKWDDHRGRWLSGPWEFRRSQMFLSPGSSPMGLRLPLQSLPWVAPEQRERPLDRSPFEPLPPLPDWAATAGLHSPIAQNPACSGGANFPLCPPGQAAAAPSPAVVPHSAMCFEIRDGSLFVFMPPVALLEHYLALLAAVEQAAMETGVAVFLEGYEPPSDPRLQRFSISPDPGVLEVNIHPADNWDELLRNTEILYEQARAARLGTEKFLLDGRHTGTGGGNHVTLGGPTPADSPLLRRPTLLASLVTYWQHHPGLSYLFSGMFIGPTSQAPRVDEARPEQLYELEIAFEQLPSDEAPPFWLVDRIFRNLLVDVTGNTHRAEFCIDKLFSPDSSSGRQGLLEMRAFDMPPHARMSAVQMLLIRALVAWFWEHPYRHRLVRWGTELHDRFMLPHYVYTDIKSVVDDLRRAGFAFQMEWFDPFFEFRFPHYGAVALQDIQLELRMALEPWHVLGEEVTRAGTARFVDSSVERLQVRASGLTDTRYVIACNGRRLPLRGTGTHGEYVCGVRYRAWQPPSALHPTIGVHCPLVFDVIDLWNGRSIGGCTYHVAHPGGRNYETLPVNAYEAEARRISRFWDHGHTPGLLELPPEAPSFCRFAPRRGTDEPMAPPPEEISAEYPHTLDLRRSMP